MTKRTLGTIGTLGSIHSNESVFITGIRGTKISQLIIQGLIDAESMGSDRNVILFITDEISPKDKLFKILRQEAKERNIDFVDLNDTTFIFTSGVILDSYSHLEGMINEKGITAIIVDNIALPSYGHSTSSLHLDRLHQATTKHAILEHLALLSTAARYQGVFTSYVANFKLEQLNAETIKPYLEKVDYGFSLDQDWTLTQHQLNNVI